MKRADPIIALVFAAIVAYYAATPGIFEGKASGDGIDGFLYLKGIVFNHSLDLGVTAPDRAAHLALAPEVTGHVANPVPIGVIPFWMPFYLLGLAIQGLLRMPITGRSTIDYWFAGVGALSFGLAGAALLFALLRRRFGLGAARFGTTGVLVATPLAWYLVTQPLYQHATAFFAVTLLIERWDAWRERPSIRDVVLLGAIGGIAMAVRIQAAPWAALVGIDLLLRAPDVRRALRLALAFGATATIAFAPQMLVWYWQFGAVRPPQPPGHMRWSDPAVVEVLFSTRAGLFPWSPILYLAIPGILLAGRRWRALAAVTGIGFALQAFINASAWDFHASYTFGARRFVDGGFAFAVGLAAVYGAMRAQWRRSATAALWLACIAAAVLNLTLMEAVRTRRLWDSAAVAAPASEYVRHLGGPRWLAAALGRTGYPFVQPAGWIWAAVHRASPSTFEAVVGNYIVDRDFRMRNFLLHPAEVPVALGSPYRIDDGGARVRVLFPMQNSEPLRLSIVGSFPRHDTCRLAWNGRPLDALPRVSAFSARVPADWVRTRSRTNELTIEGLGEGATLDRIEVGVDPWR